MSVINRMLQDLAQRQASPHQLPEQIEALAPLPVRKKWLLRFWLTGMTLLNLAVIAWFVHHTTVRKIATASSSTTIVKPVVALHPIPLPLAQISRQRPPVIANAALPAISSAVPITPPATSPAATITPPAATAKPDSVPTSGIVSTARADTGSIPVAPASAVPEKTTDLSTKPGTPSPDNHAADRTSIDGTITIKKQTRQLTAAQQAQNDYVRAINLAQQGDMAGAITGFNQVLALDSHHHQARLMLAGLLVENKQLNDAEKLLQTGLAQDPSQIDFATLLARLQIEQGSLNDSIATLMHSLPYAANQADYQAFLAALLQRAGKNDQAIDHYVIALKQNPQSGLWWMGLGISEKAAGHAAEAHEAFARAKATNSLSPDLQAYVEQQLRRP